MFWPAILQRCFTNSWNLGKDYYFCVAASVSVETGRINHEQEKEEIGNDSQRTSEKTRTSEKNEEIIKDHDQKVAMNRNTFKQRLLLEGWLVVDRMPLREATDIELRIFEGLIFFKSRVSRSMDQ